MTGGIIAPFRGVGTAGALTRNSEQMTSIIEKQTSGRRYTDNVAFASGGVMDSFVGERKVLDLANEAQTVASSLEMSAVELINLTGDIKQLATEVLEYTHSDEYISGNGTADSASKATAWLTKLQDLLNRRDNITGDYFFSGASDVAPVSDIVAGDIEVAGELTANYYQGSSAPRAYEIFGSEVKLDLNAAAPAVRDLIHTLQSLRDNKTVDQVQALSKNAAIEVETQVVIAAHKMKINVAGIKEKLAVKIANIEENLEQMTKLDDGDKMRLMEEMKNGQMLQMMIMAMTRNIKSMWEL